MRLIDADATVEYLREFRCKDCDRRKGMKNGKIRFCYEIGGVPCRACDIGDTIDYFLDEAISPTVDAIPVVRCKDCIRYQPLSEKSHLGNCPYRFDVIREDGYCEKGEPKDGEQE